MKNTRGVTFFKRLKNLTSTDWDKIQDENIWSVFFIATKEVKAYREFLKNNNIFTR
jgi:hypothetical protein